MNIWFKKIKDNRIIAETVIEKTGLSRTQRVFTSLEEVCQKWDLAVPIWLDTNVKDFKYRARTRFYQDSFAETIDFDYLEIQVIEE